MYHQLTNWQEVCHTKVLKQGQQKFYYCCYDSEIWESIQSNFFFFFKFGMRIRSSTTKNSVWEVMGENLTEFGSLADRKSSSTWFRYQIKIQLVCWWFPHSFAGQEGHGPVEVGPEEGHRNDQRVGMLLLRGKAERIGAVKKKSWRDFLQGGLSCSCRKGATNAVWSFKLFYYVIL